MINEMINPRRVALCNLGCKVNDFDTESIKACFVQAGYEAVDFSESADVYVVNTCTVTHLGDRKSRQMLRKARRKNPDAVIVATGCYAQVAPEEVEKLEEVDIVVGTQHRAAIVNYVEAFAKNRHREFHVEPIAADAVFEEMPLAEDRSHTRAVVKVQDGCNQFCSYCIVPYARGRIRSRSIASACGEVERLVADGFSEFVLTGIHIASYGRDKGDGTGLIDLITAIAAIAGVRRIRLGSLEPSLMTEAFTRALAQIPAFCPHFHLSLQSGSPMVLRRMNRHYTPEEFAEIVARIRRYFDHPAITTDIIVGFPGETEAEFEETLDFVERIDFYRVHVFKYSRRHGTRAADFPDQVDEPVKHRRSQALIALSAGQELAFLRENDGLTAPVLFEKSPEDGWWEGHTPNYIPVRLVSSERINGKIKDVVIHFNKQKNYMTGSTV